MAEFVCKVADATGAVFQQVEAAQSEAEVRHKLAERGLYVYSVQPRRGLLPEALVARVERGFSANDFLMFNQQFCTLLKAGLPILTALDLLAERAASPRMRPILRDVRQRVRDGALLSEAFHAQAVFPVVYTTSILAGERSGSLTGVLEHYIAFQRVASSFRNRLKVALIYPTILVIAVTVILSFLVTYAVPRFAELYAETNVPLPTLTRIVLGVALPLRKYLLVILAAIAAVVTASLLWLRREGARINVDRFKPRLPLVGDIWLKAQVAQFVRTLATLLSGGTPLVPALETAAGSIGSPLMSSLIHQAGQRVREGESLHASLAAMQFIPELAVEMIEVGEASGALAPMLSSVAEFYEEEVNLKLARVLAWIEPAILVGMALVVGLILVSLYLPIFSFNVGYGSG